MKQQYRIAIVCTVLLNAVSGWSGQESPVTVVIGKDVSTVYQEGSSFDHPGKVIRFGSESSPMLAQYNNQKPVPLFKSQYDELKRDYDAVKVPFQNAIKTYAAKYVSSQVTRQLNRLIPPSSSDRTRLDANYLAALRF